MDFASTICLFLHIFICFFFYTKLHRFYAFRFPPLLSLLLGALLPSILVLCTYQMTNLPTVHILKMLVMLMTTLLIMKISDIPAILFSVFFCFHSIALQFILYGMYSIAYTQNLQFIVTNNTLVTTTWLITNIITLAFLFFAFHPKHYQNINALLHYSQESKVTMYIHIALFFFLVLSSYNLLYNFNYVWYSLYQIMIGFTAELLYWIILRYAFRTSQFYELSLSNKRKIDALSQIGYADTSNSYMQSINALKHTYNELFLSLSYLLETNDIEEMQQVLTSNKLLFESHLPTLSQLSNNRMIFGLLFQYQILLQEKGISFQPRMYIPHNLSIGDNELHRILSILLENMMIENEHLEKPFHVHLHSKTDEHWFKMELQHSFYDRIIIKDNTPYSLRKKKYLSLQDYDFINKLITEVNGIFLLESNNQTSSLTTLLAIPLYQNT